MRITLSGSMILSVSAAREIEYNYSNFFQITAYFSTVHLFIHDQSFYEQLQKFASNIVTLGLIKDVKLHDSSKIDELQKFVIKSTAGSGCSFGIETNHLFESKKEESDLNAKKLEKLEKDLDKLVKTVSNEGYVKSANSKIQAKHSDKVSRAEIRHFSFLHN